MIIKALFLILSAYAAEDVVTYFTCDCCKDVVLCLDVQSLMDLEICRLAIPKTCFFRADFTLTLSNDDSICNREELIKGTNILSLNLNEVFESPTLSHYLSSIHRVSVNNLYATKCEADIRSGRSEVCPSEIFGDINDDFMWAFPVGAVMESGVKDPIIVFSNQEDNDCSTMFKTSIYLTPYVHLRGIILGPVPEPVIPSTSTTLTTSPEGVNLNFSVVGLISFIAMFLV